MGGLASTIVDRPFGGISACAVGGLPTERSLIAAVLGLLPGQFGSTRGGAIQADIDLPAGFWRVWPERGIGLWVGRSPGQPPPLQRWRPCGEIDLLQTILRLGERDVWLYEGQLHGDAGWTTPMSLKSTHDTLTREPGQFDALFGEFGDSSGRSHTALVRRAGCVETSSPSQAVRLLSIAYDLTSD